MAIELNKVVNGLFPEFLKDVFPLKECNRYCTRFPFKSRNLRTVNYGTESISSLGPKTWSIIPNDIKNYPVSQYFRSLCNCYFKFATFSLNLKI